MLITVLIILAIVWAFSFSGPRYYPAYTSRYNWYPLWGSGSHMLLVILAILVMLWFLGVFRF